jgi:hypothetical protein
VVIDEQVAEQVSNLNSQCTVSNAQWQIHADFEHWALGIGYFRIALKDGVLHQPVSRT